ncbi:prepilin peptidase [Paenibacillus sp. EPM92]|uniref:A24 family peptidase n=1 Tax=Paenibacillus sp. EPM92 TaxID=1561195 RepID=UPI001F292D35|nr:A24 family peptidase [Paenibacillus sp. EPM92]
MWAWWMVGMMLALAFATDIRKQIIPNWLTAAGIGAGLLGHGMAQGGYGLAFSAAGLACGFIPMLLLYALGGVGAGDVKLFGALGAMTGAVFTLYAMVASLFFAGLIALIVFICRHDRMVRLKETFAIVFQLWILRDLSGFTSSHREDGKLRFPFMWAVLPGTVYSFIYGGDGLF